MESRALFWAAVQRLQLGVCAVNVEYIFFWLLVFGGPDFLIVPVLFLCGAAGCAPKLVISLRQALRLFSQRASRAVGHPLLDGCHFDCF